MDDYIPWIEAYALERKDQVGSALESYIIKGPGKMDRNRSDNAPEFRGPQSAWIKVHVKHDVKPTFSIQYEPQTNGKAERFIRTYGNAVRAVMCGVDILLWEFAPDYVSHTFNRLDRKSGVKSPYYQISLLREPYVGRDPKTHYFRRFGCLCYAKVHVLKKDQELTSKVAPRYEPGVFLGYNANSTYKVGVWRRDGRSHTGWLFHVMDNRTVKFDESRLISDINSLRSKGSFVSFALPDALRDSCIEAGDVGPLGSHEPSSCASSPSREISFSKADNNAAAETDGSPVREVAIVNGKANLDLPVKVSSKASLDGVSVDADCADSPPPGEAFVEQDQSNSSEPGVVNDEPEVPLDPRIVVDENGITRKRRGRLPGVKAKPEWKKPGPKPKAGALKVFGDNAKRAIDLKDAESECWEAFYDKCDDLKGEEACSFNVQLEVYGVR